LLALVLLIVSRVGDYLVAVLFVDATHNNLQELTILIGNAWLASYVVQLIVSLFIAPWVLNRLGVKNAIMVLPAFTVIGFVAVAVNPVLATALFLFIVRNGLQTGLDDPAQNVLAGAMPATVVPRLKFLLDNAVMPGAAAVSGAGLLLLQAAVVANVEVLALTGIALAVLLVLAAWWVRSLYVDAIYSRLRTHALSLADFQQAVGRPTPDQIVELQGYIRGADDKTRQFAAAARAAAFVADGVTVVKAMGDADPLVRLEGIRAFARMKGEVPAVAGVLIECMRDGEVEVRREALRQALRWAPPPDWQQPYAEALA